MGRVVFDVDGELSVVADWLDAPEFLASGWVLRDQPVKDQLLLRAPLSDARLPDSAQAPPPAAPAESPVQEEEDLWLELEVQDEQGQPLVAVRYRVSLPDGSVREGTTDSHGFVRLRSPRRGRCTLSLPEVDGEAWRLA